MSREYIDLMKILIKQNVNQRTEGKQPVTSDFIDQLRTKIIIKTRLFIEDGRAPVDEITISEYFDIARNEFLSVNPISIEISTTLTKIGFETWLNQKRISDTKWDYFERYQTYLTKKGRAEEVVKEINRSSLDILSRLGDPKDSNAFFVKGLVVGEVQSGKTGNFNAVINRSIDTGYQLIIILSGIMEDLRQQTQDRTELEFVGEGWLKDLQRMGTKGVGEINRFGRFGGEQVEQVESITTYLNDFNSVIVGGNNTLNSPKVLICKKNVSILKNILIWLAGMVGPNGKIDIPLLVLDDEADNASLNNEGKKGKAYASQVNAHIRAILALFTRKTYLGYTATPFANVLQDRNTSPEKKWPVSWSGNTKEFELVENLFPDDFITLLESPTNYIGAKQIFETVGENQKLPIIYPVDDYYEEFPSRLIKDTEKPIRAIASLDQWISEIGSEKLCGFSSYAEYKAGTRATKRDDDFPKKLPQSLKEAILCFVLSTAVRESRKAAQKNWNLYQPNNSMLIHISKFTPWQNKTRDLIQDYILDLKTRIENEPKEGQVFIELETIWNKRFHDIVENIKDYLNPNYEDAFMVPIVFKSVQRYLPRAVQDLSILAINSNTNQKLKYDDKKPMSVIAVGGNRLSRGFTVEGLSINYFVRTTNYSDTLMQMGRWFGYRPGYVDCCRIFTTSDAIEKFNSTTRCIEELEAEFKRMEELGKEPKNFMLRVRKHPGVLQITRPAIMKNTAVVNWSYSDKLEMTTRFKINATKMSSQWDSFKTHVIPKLISAESFKSDDGGFKQVDISSADFIALFRNLETNFDQTLLSQMIKFIELCNSQNKLIKWRIALKLTGDSKNKIKKSISGLDWDICPVIRRGPKDGILRDEFLNSHIFRASGKSANILSSSMDMSITLTQAEKIDAQLQFRREKINTLVKKGMSREEATIRVQKISAPERAYRERINEQQGIVVFYLFDTSYVFRQDSDPKDIEFENLAREIGVNFEIPLIGAAIGFPPINDDPGGVYAHGDYDLDDEDEEAEDEEIDSDDDLVPNDADGAQNVI